LGLTDQQQAVAMFLVFVLPALVTWSALGMPYDRVALGLLFSNILSGFIVALKEVAGWKPAGES